MGRVEQRRAEQNRVELNLSATYTSNEVVVLLLTENTKYRDKNQLNNHTALPH